MINRQSELRKHSLLGPVALLLLASFIGTTDASVPEPLPEYVVIVVLDGFRTDYVTLYETPTLQELIQNGAWFEQAVGVFPANSTVNQTSLVTGAHPRTTGIPNNARYDRASDRILTGLRDNRARTIGEVFSEAGLRTAAISHYMLEGKVDTYGRHFADALNLLRRETKPHLLVYLNLEVDTIGHRHGPFSTQTARAVRQADDEIRRLIDTLKTEGIYEKTVIVVVSDHGMSPGGGQPIRPTLEYQLWAHDFIVTRNERDIFDKTDIVHLQYGSAFLYLREGRFTTERTAKLIDVLRGIEGVDILGAEALEALHVDPERLGDVVVIPQEGYTLYPGTSNSGIHGRPQESQITLLFSGAGIRKGVKLGEAAIIDVVPTVLHLFDLPIPDTVDGKVLYDVLQR